MFPRSPILLAYAWAWGIAMLCLKTYKTIIIDDFLRQFIRITLFHLNNNSFPLTAIYILNQVANYILKFN